MILFMDKGVLALFVPDHVITGQTGEHRNLMAAVTQGLAQFIEQMGRGTHFRGEKGGYQ